MSRIELIFRIIGLVILGALGVYYGIELVNYLHDGRDINNHITCDWCSCSWCAWWITRVRCRAVSDDPTSSCSKGFISQIISLYPNLCGDWSGGWFIGCSVISISAIISSRSFWANFAVRRCADFWICRCHGFCDAPK